MRVYCSDCKFLVDQLGFFPDYCKAEGNRIYKPDWESNKYRCIRPPWKINKFGDCRWYEEK